MITTIPKIMGIKNFEVLQNKPVFDSVILDDKGPPAVPLSNLSEMVKKRKTEDITTKTVHLRLANTKRIQSELGISLLAKSPFTLLLLYVTFYFYSIL